MQQEIQNLQQELHNARSSGKRGISNGPLGEFDDIESVQSKHPFTFRFVLIFYIRDWYFFNIVSRRSK